MLGLRTVARTTPLYGCHGPRSSSSNRAAQAAQHVTLTSTSVDPLHLCHPQASYLSTSTSASTTRPRLSSVQQIRCENSNNMRKRRFRIPYYEINRNKTKRLQDTPKKLMATMTGLRSGNLESLEKIVRPTKILTSGKFDKYSETRRSFWTWRGGDDKRWDFSSSMSETAVSTSTDRGEQQANSEELEPASPAATSTVSASEDFTLDKSLKIPASATIDNEDDRLSADGEKANQSSATAASSTTTQQCPPTPITTYEVSACTAQGYRTYMEDEFFLSLDGDFAAVFDGHGGRAVSRYLRQNLYANLQAMLPVVVTPATTSPIPSPSRDVHNDSATLSVDGSNSPHSDDNTESDVATSKRSSPTVKDYENAVSAALAKVDREVQRISHWSYQGSTAVVIWIHEDRNGNSPPARLKQADGGLVGMPGSLSPASTSKPDQHSTTEEPSITDTTTPSNVRTIIAANIGDSRAVLCRDGVAWDLTRDHKPNDPHEQERIERLGGKVRLSLQGNLQ